jgi:hypothetical protein
MSGRFSLVGATFANAVSYRTGIPHHLHEDAGLLGRSIQVEPPPPFFRLGFPRTILTTKNATWRQTGAPFPKASNHVNGMSVRTSPSFVVPSPQGQEELGASYAGVVGCAAGRPGGVVGQTVV